MDLCMVCMCVYCVYCLLCIVRIVYCVLCVLCIVCVCGHMCKVCASVVLTSMPSKSLIESCLYMEHSTKSIKLKDIRNTIIMCTTIVHFPVWTSDKVFTYWGMYKLDVTITSWLGTIRLERNHVYMHVCYYTKVACNICIRSYINTQIVGRQEG